MQDDKDVIVLTRKAMLIRFLKMKFPQPTGRQGVAAIKLNKEDSLCFGALFGEGDELILVSERGYAKRIIASFIDVQHRAGMVPVLLLLQKRIKRLIHCSARGYILPKHYYAFTDAG